MTTLRARLLVDRTTSPERGKPPKTCGDSVDDRPRRRVITAGRRPGVSRWCRARRRHLAGAQVDLVMQSGRLERLLDGDVRGRLGRPVLQVPLGVQSVRGSLRELATAPSPRGSPRNRRSAIQEQTCGGILRVVTRGPVGPLSRSPLASAGSRISRTPTSRSRCAGADRRGRVRGWRPGAVSRCHRHSRRPALSALAAGTAARAALIA